jgi:hypothetical protein
MIAPNLAEGNAISLVGKKIYTYIYINLLKKIALKIHARFTQAF